MRKRGSFILVSFIFSLMVIGSASALPFSEDFGEGADWTTTTPGWSKSDTATSGRDDQLSRTGGSDENYYAWLIGDSGDQNITKTGISAVGYQNIKINYYYNLYGDFAQSDYLFVEWKLNSELNWNNKIVIQKTTGLSGWNYVNFNLPGAENKVIDIRFRENGLDPGDYIFVDDINISGSSIANCGNGVVDNVEECDDGDLNSDESACSSKCTLTFCGDGTPQSPNGNGAGEVCDDGNLINSDSCNNNCGVISSPCGNSIIDPGEQCELPSTTNNDYCTQTTTDCQGAKQGTRDALGNCNSICGCAPDSFTNYQCVKGQCGAACAVNADCNDDNPSTTDTCNLDACSCANTPIGPVCGNGVPESGEQCDDGNFNNHDNCLNTCETPTCGDGFLWTGSNEKCDDGDNINGDGCSADCNFEGGGQCFAPIDVMLVIDRSFSMNNGSKLADAKSAAITFVNEVNFSKDNVGLASFNHVATLNQGLTSNKPAVISAINALTASGQTNIGDGIKVARQELIDNGGTTKAMILLSDGAPNTNSSGLICFGAFSLTNSCAKHALNESNFTKLAGIEIFVIGLGVDNLTETLLKQIATTPSNYFSAPNSSQLEAIYLQIAQEICPCGGFDCSINSDQCNVGSCNLQTDQCEFNPQPISTSCEEDSTKCTTQHCNGQGACVVNDTVEVPQAQECNSFFCDPLDGLVKEDFTAFPLSTPCQTDQDACTTQHCNGAGTCVVNDTVDVPQAEQCRSFFCDPADGQVKPDDFQLSTTCEADGNLCTIDHCDGQGSCVLNNNKDCSGLNGQCQEGVCNPSTGNCQADYSNFPLSTTCQADQSLCTLDHCNGVGACINFGSVPVPPAEQCRSFFCDPADGIVKPNNFQLSTFCQTDEDECTIQHCNGFGQCTIDPEAELPPQCVATIPKDSKVAQAMPTANFGLGRYMMVNPKQGATDRSYIRIDTSQLNSLVNTADLKVAVYQTGGSATNTKINAYYCRNHDFVETTINWQNQPLDNNCALADTFTILNEVVAGSPLTWHSFDLTNETNFEEASGDGLFTIVLRSAEENTGVANNKKYVQYLTKDYSEAAFRPKLEVT